MKAVLLILTTLLTLEAGHIEDFAKEFHYETSYESALELAKDEEKPIMLLMVTHYCPWCQKFEKKVLSHPSIDSLLSKRYVKLILNRERQEFPKKFDTLRIPTTYFINAKDESIIYTNVGYLNKEEFLKILQNDVIEK